jgi:hypothetical protein
MKRITAIALLTIAGFVTAGGALAQDHGVKATVPFDFNVGYKLLPAGTYTIASAGTGAIEIRSSDRSIAVMSTVLAASNEPAKSGELVFDRYGDQYFLSEVLCPSAALNVHLPTSKLEKRARTNEARLHKSDQTLIAAK